MEETASTMAAIIQMMVFFRAAMGLIAILLTNDENGQKPSIFSSLPPSGEVVNLEFRGSTKNAPPPTKAEGAGEGRLLVLHGKLGGKQGLRRSPKKLHAEGA